MANKILFGLCNVHYAKLTETTDPVTGKVTNTYGTPHAWPGAVSLGLDPQSELLKEYADNMTWHVQDNNKGYEGDYEYEVMPEDFRENILGEVKDPNGVFHEVDNAGTTYFALMFEINGDAKARRNLLYKCSATRESLSGSTKGESIEPAHGTITITAISRSDHELKASTSEDADATAYAGWYDAVYEKPAATEAGKN